jgi:hypothetical protein
MEVNMSKEEHFLLIKAWGAGFWSDMDDVQTKLMLAEITNRQPVVYWGKNSRYLVSDQVNSFEQYFQPVSKYSVTDLVNEEYSYYPLHWNYSNIYPDKAKRRNWKNRDISGFIRSAARVVVSDCHNYMYELIPWIPASHPVYGQIQKIQGEPLPQKLNDAFYERVQQCEIVNRYIIKKYLKLQPEIVNEIEAFYHANMKTGPVLAVHVRFDLETAAQWSDYYRVNLNDLNDKYFGEIDKYLQANSQAHIFLMTANQRVLDRYLQRYGDVLIYTDCKRGDLHTTIFENYPRIGIEIIKDTYLASKCNQFIGSKYSNVAWTIRRLKEWDEGTFKLLE